MAVLTKHDIVEAIKNEAIAFEPVLDGFQLQPHAVDLRLGMSFYIPKSWAMTDRGREALRVDPLSEVKEENFDIIELQPGQYFEILPNEFVIASTLERIEINHLGYMAVLYPRSSINRRGLSVNLSGIIDTGYAGHLMIPIQNNTTNQIIKIYPGERICQIVFEELTGALTRDEADTHGLSRAKYHDANEGSLGMKQDKAEEMKLIQEGNIEGLKTRFAI